MWDRNFSFSPLEKAHKKKEEKKGVFFFKQDAKENTFLVFIKFLSLLKDKTLKNENKS